MKHLAEESFSIREKNRILSKTNIKWDLFPRKLLIVHKETDIEFLRSKVEELVKWISDQWKLNSQQLELIGIYPNILKDVLCFENNENVVFFENKTQIHQEIDLIITLGGDGTVLLAAWLFQGHVPPIVPFHFGTLGFLTIFNWETFEARMQSILTSGSRFNTRLRLNCRIHKPRVDSVFEFNVLNEIVVERGASPFMSILDIYGDDKFLTKIQADGVSIATPTGSTAYSVIKPNIPFLYLILFKQHK